MSKSAKIIDVIPKIPQFGQFEYVRDYRCPECDKDYFDGEMNLCGWCDTEIGYQIIVECSCGCKFRFHAGNWYKFDKEEFVKEVEAQFIFIKNQSEIKDKLTEFINNK